MNQINININWITKMPKELSANKPELNQANEREITLENQVMEKYKVDRERAKEMIQESREAIEKHRKTPDEFMTKIFSKPTTRIVALGESHEEIGRVLTGEMLQAAHKNGVSILFLEADINDQPAIDKYIKTKDISVLPGYLQILEEQTKSLSLAAKNGIKLVAVDNNPINANSMRSGITYHPSLLTII
jgi:hypothetical protein